MGSLRNPIGPLPSSIYWRRRVVLLSVIALLALLITWVVTSGGGGGDNGAQGSNGKNPASSITPGPSGSGPAISQAPGGRDEPTEGADGGGSGDDGSGTGGGGSDDGANGNGDGGGAGGGTGTGGSGGIGIGSGTTLPAGTTLPNCTASVVTLSLRSVNNEYAPGQTPTFRLTAKNSSGSDCKVDLGPKKAVLTITKTGSTDPYWSTADCPADSGSRLYRVVAGDTFTYTVTWNRKPSAAECATPPAGSAGPGTYLVEVRTPGFANAQTSFVLAED